MAEQLNSVTALLENWASGDRAALDQVIPLMYAELRRIARFHLQRERPGHTLQATALIHEAYARLVGQECASLKNRNHFLAIASELMRRILVDYARSNLRAKRGGSARKISLDDAPVLAVERPDEIVALDDALIALAARDPRKVKVVELRFFGGASVEETAEVLQVSPNTVIRDWSLARAWLKREMTRQDG